MLNYLFLLIGLYTVYYLGNIVYDLFLKKDKTLITEEKEEYSLEDVVSNTPMQVNIDDVEEMIIPNSFQKSDVPQEAENYRPDIEELRRQFESEEEIDSDLVKETKSEEILTSQNQEEDKKTSRNDWQAIMKLSETTVQMVANYDGQKVYHSVL